MAIRWRRSARRPTDRVRAAVSARVPAAASVPVRAAVSVPAKAAASAAACSASAAALPLRLCSSRSSRSTPKKPARRSTRAPCCCTYRSRPDGKATNIRVLRSLGLGLDEKAIEAVKQWKFKPGYKDGKPVTVEATDRSQFPAAVRHRSRRKRRSGTDDFFTCQFALLALRARADPPEVVVRVDAGVVAVAPVDADGVVAHRLHVQHLQRRLVHLERVRLGRFGLAAAACRARRCRWRRGTRRAGSAARTRCGGRPSNRS